MKTSLLSRLCLLGLLLVLSAPLAMAQKSIYSEAPVGAKTGYWTLETDQATPNYTLVRFYNDQHKLLHEVPLSGSYQHPGRSAGARRRVARLLGAALQQVQRIQARSPRSMRLVALNRYMHRAYAVR